MPLAAPVRGTLAALGESDLPLLGCVGTEWHVFGSVRGAFHTIIEENQNTAGLEIHAGTRRIMLSWRIERDS